MYINSFQFSTFISPEYLAQSQIITTLKEAIRSHDNQHADILILIFSEAFNTVSHEQFLNKLEYSGICNKT